MTAIRAAVGGEAVAWMIDSSDPRDRIVTNDDSVVATWRAIGITVIPLYASPPATVDVGALQELVSKWALHNSSSDERGEGFSAGLDLCAMQLAALVGEEA